MSKAPSKSPNSLWTGLKEKKSIGEIPAFTNVCIIGAGIAGMSIAYFLSRQGRDVVVLEVRWNE